MQIIIRILGVIFFPFFTIPYLIVEWEEESNTRYIWPDGTTHRQPWPRGNTRLQALADAQYKQRWKDEAVDMTAINNILYPK